MNKTFYKHHLGCRLFLCKQSFLSDQSRALGTFQHQMQPGETLKIANAYIGRYKKLYRLTEGQVKKRRKDQAYKEKKKGITYSERRKRLTEINFTLT